MKINFLTFLLAFGLIGFAVSSCNGDDDCDTAGLTYTNFAGDFITSNCGSSGCHGSGTMATFEMSDYATTSAAVGFNRMVGAINHSAGFSPMPKGGDKLDDCDIDKLTQWINDGAPE